MELDKLEKLTQELYQFWNSSHIFGPKHHVGMISNPTNVVIDIQVEDNLNEVRFNLINMIYSLGLLANKEDFLYASKSVQDKLAKIITTYFPNIKGDIIFTYDPSKLIISFDLE